MSKKTKIISIITSIFILTIISITVIVSHALKDSYTICNLNDLYDIRNDSNRLKEVNYVIITKDDNLEYVNLLYDLPNLSGLSIEFVPINDITFINNINHDFTLSYSGGYEGFINLDGINNPFITSVGIANTKIDNFTSIQGLSSLNNLELWAIYNYNDLDYNVLFQLHDLNSLAIRSTRIDNYQSFFNIINELSNLKTLSLDGGNIQNKDVKYLKQNQYLETLILSQALITDISFLKEMTNLKYIDLPANITDFSALYELNNNDFYIRWDNYTEYNVTSDLVQYLDSKGISHTTYYSSIKNIVDGLVEEADILPTDDDYTKVLKVMKILQSNYRVGHPDVLSGEGETSLSYITLQGTGVCNNWAALANVMLKIVGVESYKVGGFFYNAGHAWNIIKTDDKILGFDIMNARPNPSNYLDMSTWQNNVRGLILRDTLRVDSYREVDAIRNGWDYNYEFPNIFIETDGFNDMMMYYDFDIIDGITNITQKNIWVDLNTNISSINLVPISGYSYKYYDKNGNNKNTGIAESGDYIIVTSSNNANYSHKYEIIVEEKMYEIKLESDSFGKNESIRVKNGGKYTGLFTPIKYCYKFLGWYTAKTGGTLITEDSIVDISKVDTLYAHWEHNDKQHILTVNPGGKCIFNEDDVYYNAKNIDYDSVPQLYSANYACPQTEKFSGYYTQKDGGLLITFFSKVIANSDHEIYSHCVDKNATLYTINAKCAECKESFYIDWPIEPNAKIASFYTPTREGYTFKYWAVNGEEFDFNTPITSNITLEAVWEEKPTGNYTITYDKNDGTGTVMSDSTTDNNGKVTLKVNSYTAPTGKAFKEWNSQADGKGVSYVAGEQYTFTSNITLYAIWEKLNITISDITNTPIVSNSLFFNDKTGISSVNVSTGYTYKVLNNNGIIKTTGNIGTGDRIEFYLESDQIFSYDVILSADVNGDANLSMMDYMMIRTYLTGKTNLTGLYLVAADVNQDNKISMMDYMTLKYHLIKSN